MLIPHNSVFIFCVLEEKELISTARALYCISTHLFIS
jgi:hypothetical protein